MRTLHTKYRVYRILDEPNIVHPHEEIAKLEKCTHIEFEIPADAESWLRENSDPRTSEHEYTILPCIRVLHPEE